jgi:hypothetical protein
LARSRIPRVFVVLSVWLGSGVAPASAFLIDNLVHTPPDYVTLVPPAPGNSYVDPVFGTTIKRLSDARQTVDAAAGSGVLEFITNEYSTMSPFNSNATQLLLQHQSYFGLYDGHGRFLKNLPFEVSASTEPRWSRADPDALYFVSGNRLKKLNVGSGTTTVVHTFTEYGGIRGAGESDICFDGDHFVLAGDGRYIFVYEISTDRKGPVFDTGGHGFDSLYITPNDNVTITWHQSGTARYNGIELFDRDMRFLRQVTRAGGHMDVTRDANGDEVLVWCNSADPQPICNNGVVKVRLSDGAQTCLVSLDWSLALHVSAPDAGGWAFVETYAPGDPSPLGGGWHAYTSEIFQVKLDASERRRLAHHRSRPFDSYYYTPRVASDRGGRTLVFSSNYGRQAHVSLPSEYTDTYLLTVPGATGPTPTPSARPTASPTPRPAPTATPTPTVTPRPAPTATPTLTATPRSTPTATPSPTPTPTSAPRATSTPRPTAPPTTTPSPTSTPAPQKVRREQTDPSATYSGTWYPNSLSLHSRGSAVLAVDTGARVTVTFSGTGITWIGYRDEWSGVARVYVDGVLRATVDTYASPARAQAALFTSAVLANGTHTLTIEAAGVAGPQSGGAWVWIDAFDVVTAGNAPPTPVARFEQDSAAVTYAGTWSPHRATAHSGGSAVLSAEAGARATFPFTGTGVRWIAYRDERGGRARVYIDGGLVGTIDTYAAPAQARAMMFEKSGLARGAHTLVVEVTRTRRPASSGFWVWADAFDVIP